MASQCVMMLLETSVMTSQLAMTLLCEPILLCITMPDYDFAISQIFNSSVVLHKNKNNFSWSSVKIMWIVFVKDISLILQTHEISLDKNNSHNLHRVITHSLVLVIRVLCKCFVELKIFKISITLRILQALLYKCTWKINQNISPYNKTQTIIIARIIVGMTINISITSQPSTKQYIFTKVDVKCLFMVQFWKLEVLLKGGKLSDTSKFGSVSNLGVKILQNWLSWAAHNTAYK